MNTKLSLIIPVYNVAKYLSKCLDSCLTQDIPFEEYEIIAINDGSTDESGQILNMYSKKYPNIHIITQRNQGLSIARNNGMNIAKADYVWFIDSDDWIEDNCLKNILFELKDGLDMLQLKHNLAFENGEIRSPRKRVFEWEGIMTGKQILKKGGLPNPVQFMIFRKKFLKENNLMFTPNILHEDVEFKPRAVYFAKKIKLYKTSVYYYLQRQGSITSNYKLKNAEDLILALRSLQSFKGKYVNDLYIKRYFDGIVGLQINSILSAYKKADQKMRNDLKKLLEINKDLFKFMGCSNSIKYRIESVCFRLNIRFALSLYCALTKFS